MKGGREKPIKSELRLWATGAPCCWGPSKNLCGTHLRNVPVKNKELVFYPAISVRTLLLRIWIMPEPDPAKSSGAEESLQTEKLSNASAPNGK